MAINVRNSLSTSTSLSESQRAPANFLVFNISHVCIQEILVQTNAVRIYVSSIVSWGVRLMDFILCWAEVWIFGQRALWVWMSFDIYEFEKENSLVVQISLKWVKRLTKFDWTYLWFRWWVGEGGAEEDGWWMRTHETWSGPEGRTDQADFIIYANWMVESMIKVENNCIYIINLTQSNSVSSTHSSLYRFDFFIK